MAKLFFKRLEISKDDYGPPQIAVLPSDAQLIGATGSSSNTAMLNVHYTTDPDNAAANKVEFRVFGQNNAADTDKLGVTLDQMTFLATVSFKDGSLVYHVFFRNL